MDARTRCLQILDILQQKHKVKVKDLAALFGTSEMTIRRDLNILTQQYNIIRTHGGAKLIQDSVVKTISFDESKIENKEAKRLIAKKAATLIEHRQKIYIDSGSTTRNMVHFFNKYMKNIIVTNSITISEIAVQFENISVVLLGGEVLPIAKCTFGPTTEEQVLNHQFDAAFLGTAAIGSDGFLYDGYSLEGRLKVSVLDLAKKVYLLVDSSKFNEFDIHKFGSLNKIDTVITDSGLKNEAKQLLNQYNVEIIYA
ncbi:MAG: DeoR/GlpR transcriptional regulator [Christensenellaceae bacterium]|nr:DeoR/GlpR transcriptional regulator [Christensenellaceae bacterium]